MKIKSGYLGGIRSSDSEYISQSRGSNSLKADTDNLIGNLTIHSSLVAHYHPMFIYNLVTSIRRSLAHPALLSVKGDVTALLFSLLLGHISPQAADLQSQSQSSQEILWTV